MSDSVTLPPSLPLVLADLLPGAVVRSTLLVVGAAPLGRYGRRSSPLVFSFVPRCQGLAGWAKSREFALLAEPLMRRLAPTGDRSDRRLAPPHIDGSGGGGSSGIGGGCGSPNAASADDMAP
jgi:hypothetical protein